MTIEEKKIKDNSQAIALCDEGIASDRYQSPKHGVYDDSPLPQEPRMVWHEGPHAERYRLLKAYLETLGSVEVGEPSGKYVERVAYTLESWACEITLEQSENCESCGRVLSKGDLMFAVGGGGEQPEWDSVCWKCAVSWATQNWAEHYDALLSKLKALTHELQEAKAGGLDELTDIAIRSGADHRTMQDKCPTCGVGRGNLLGNSAACTAARENGWCPTWREIERAESAAPQEKP